MLDLIYSQNCQYWELLKKHIPEYNQVFTNTQVLAGNYRSQENTHLLFRYVGQRAFASAVQILRSRDKSIEDAIKLLGSKTLYLHDKSWHDILWNPIGRNIITRNRVVAETYLLTRIGEAGKTKKHEQRLNLIKGSS